MTLKDLFFFLFVTIGWHLWTASDKENIRTHTPTSTVHTPQNQMNKETKEKKRKEKKRRNTVHRLNGMNE